LESTEFFKIWAYFANLGSLTRSPSGPHQIVVKAISFQDPKAKRHSQQIAIVVEKDLSYAANVSVQERRGRVQGGEEDHAK
jgi:hypothetical protein